VAAGCGDFKSAFGGLLAADIFEVEGEVLELAEEFFSRDPKGLALDHTKELRFSNSSTSRSDATG
jgi:hypothetical protein